MELNIQVKVIKNYNNVSINYILETDIKQTEQLELPYNDLSFLLEKMKMNLQQKLICNLIDIEKYVIRTRNLQLASNRGLSLTNVYKVIKFNQKMFKIVYAIKYQLKKHFLISKMSERHLQDIFRSISDKSVSNKFISDKSKSNSI